MNNNLHINDTFKATYNNIDPQNLQQNMINHISKEWMLITAGSFDACNTMTASWGGVGFIWNKPVAFIFVRDSRYTFNFLQENASFSLSFFPKSHRNTLNLCGKVSGRDADKIKQAELTKIETPHKLVSFAEANLIFECQKIITQKLDYNNIFEPFKTEIVNKYYKESGVHYFYIAEILNIWEKK